MARLNADSFTAFLEAEQSRKANALKTSPAASASGDAPESRPALTSLERAASPAAAASGGTSLSLLVTLARAPRQQKPVAELMAASGMSFGDFAGALKSLGDLGYLTLAGPPGNEVTSLTKLGEDVSRLARQA
jgi:hypothetical protein